MSDENPVVVQVTVFDQYGNSEKRDVTFTVKDDGNWYMEAAAKKRVAEVIERANAPMSDDVSKPGLSHGAELPAWPERTDVLAPMPDRLGYYYDLSDAYRARMEALVEYAQHLGGCSDGCRARKGRIMKCDCGLDALLAACEREEG